MPMTRPVCDFAGDCNRIPWDGALVADSLSVTAGHAIRCNTAGEGTEDSGTGIIFRCYGGNILDLKHINCVK